MNRTRDFRRFEKYVHVKRKERIITEVYRNDVKFWTDGERHLNKLDDRKVHCSCRNCQVKYRKYKNSAGVRFDEKADYDIADYYGLIR